MKSVITLSESKRFVALEKVIEHGKQTFVEVGLALAEIRDAKLYRADYGTFEEYCRVKWGWTRNRAYELIASAGAVKSLPEECNARITNARQATELSKVEPEKREEVITRASDKAAAESRQMTARDVKEAAVEVCEPDAAEPEPEPAPTTNDEKWLKAVGKTDARNFFASQIGDIVSAVIAGGSKEQIQAVKLTCEVSIRKLRSATA